HPVVTGHAWHAEFGQQAMLDQSGRSMHLQARPSWPARWPGSRPAKRTACRGCSRRHPAGVNASPRAVIRTPDQRLRVFVSSTLQELADERAAVAQAVRHLRLAPVMFELGARAHPPRELYRAYLDQSDVFVGIYWQRYGWVAPGEDVSGLEDEYRLAA